ncbi:MAG TPA: type II secretion system minor pseudopilin GspI [Gammaproteobacteria bacterium]|nr:type II secretion system minor pseudopilin GspI [Gammaproteobacteria bacterium]
MYPLRRHAGFTLLEVMVALAVLAIALAALVKGVSANVDNSAYLRDRTLAHWVAMNKIAEAQVRHDWPAVGSSEGTALMAVREWHWKIIIAATADPNVRRMDVEVRANARDTQALTKLISYLGKPCDSKNPCT